MEKYALIIIGIVALVGIIVTNNITGKFTETIYKEYCNPSACKAECGKPCTEYRTTTSSKCLSSYIVIKGVKYYRTWSCE